VACRGELEVFTVADGVAGFYPPVPRPLGKRVPHIQFGHSGNAPLCPAIPDFSSSRHEGVLFMRKKGSRLFAGIAMLFALIFIPCLSIRNSFGEKKAWQAGTITEVKSHSAESGDTGAAKNYDVSVKVGKKIYTVLYSLPNDRAEPEYYVGMATTVLIDGDNLKFNDLQGHTHSLHILSSKDAPSADAK